MTSRNKLDMGHGFMKSIIRNQVDRDNYDKEVRAKQQPPTSTQKKSKKPDVRTYTPPVKAKPEESQPILFTLMYEDENGAVHSLEIRQGDCPNIKARKFAANLQFTVPMTKAFADFLKGEIAKRT